MRNKRHFFIFLTKTHTHSNLKIDIFFKPQKYFYTLLFKKIYILYLIALYLNVYVKINKFYNTENIFFSLYKLLMQIKKDKKLKDILYENVNNTLIKVAEIKNASFKHIDK